MKILPYIFIFLFAFGLISHYSNKSVAFKQDNTTVKYFSDVKMIEIKNSILFIHSLDTIIVSKALKDLSIIFQLAQLHELFFKNHEYHSISITSLSKESRKSNKKKIYFKAEGSIPNLLNQYEWLIRIENSNASRKMVLEDFIKDAGAALVEVKIQI